MNNFWKEEEIGIISYNLSFISLYDNDMNDKFNRIIQLLVDNNIIIDNIKLINKTSRQYKINNLLCKNNESFEFKYAEITLNSLNYYFNIEFIKTKNNIKTIIKTDSELKIYDLKKDIKILKNKINRDVFDINHFINMLISEISNGGYDVNDNFKLFILDKLSKLKYQYFNHKINIRNKNNLLLELFLKNNNSNKIMCLSLKFFKEDMNFYYNDEYYVYDMYKKIIKYTKIKEAFANM